LSIVSNCSGLSDRGKVSSSARLTEIHRLQRALLAFMEEPLIGAWLLSPNEALDGFKPLEVIERGEIDRIWRMLYVLKGS
jgi:hypothetical protein